MQRRDLRLAGQGLPHPQLPQEAPPMGVNGCLEMATLGSLKFKSAVQITEV